MISLTVNGKTREIEDSMKLTQFLEINHIEPRLIAIEYNGEILRREEYDKVTLKDRDKVEIVHMVGGG